ncbi:hypothetical protein GCM10017706_30290 [Lactococcus lactis subsp. hordniae]
MKIKSLLMAVTTVTTLGAIGTVSAQASAVSSKLFIVFTTTIQANIFIQRILTNVILLNVWVGMMKA